MSEKLEPCPFCGGEASLTIPSEHVQADCADIYVSCDECEAEGQHLVVEMQDRTPDLWPYERRDAIAAWNTRTPANGEQVERAGWRVVPLDLTQEMLDATCATDQDDAAMRAAWIELLRTAPKPPTPTQDARGRVKALEEALEAILGGDVPRPVGKPWRADCKPSKHDRCIHDVWMYDDCPACIETFARTALGNQEERL